MAVSHRINATTLLVVDDDEGVLNLVCRLLERDGHSVIRACDGSEALALARTRGQDICVLLTDIRMPGIGGRELADAVVRLHPHIRVIYMTGFSEEQVERGAVALRKPFRLEALKLAVSRSFSPRRKSRKHGASSAA
jgi:two-component system cell cycle sensor histidine kinase/response regulator CckA